ncbi:MAG: aminotransferase class IV [Phycisphaerales bacterium]|nr:aminotransferase class IV [Phycisphaerales bacterium]
MLQQYHPANADLIVNINGALIHRDQAGVSPFDSAVQGGDAVWEGLRLYDGRIFKLTEHLDRLASSARALAFAQIPSHETIISEIRRTLEANGMRDNVHIRLTLTRGVKITSGMDPRLNQRGPTLIVLAEHKPPVYAGAMAKGGLTLAASSVRRFPPDCLDPKIHHCNLIQSILAKIEATRAGADDAVMLDTRGFVAETNATHLFMVNRRVVAGEPTDVVETPTCNACPEGITRATVIDLCARLGIPCRERDISLMEFYRADEVFCTGTMGELAWVSTIDGRPVGPRAGAPEAGPTGAAMPPRLAQGAGPVTRRLSEAFGALTRTEGVKVV